MITVHDLLKYAIVQAAQAAWQHAPNGWRNLTPNLLRTSSASLLGPGANRKSFSYQENRCTTLVHNGCAVLTRMLDLMYPRASELVRDRLAQVGTASAKHNADETGASGGVPDLYNLITCAVRVFHAPLIDVLLERARSLRQDLARGAVGGYNLLHDLAKTDIEHDVVFGSHLSTGPLAAGGGSAVAAAASRGPSAESTRGRSSESDEKTGAWSGLVDPLVPHACVLHLCSEHGIMRCTCRPSWRIDFVHSTAPGLQGGL